MITPTCEGCGERPSVCFHRAGKKVFGCRSEAKCYLCNVCCGHSGEEGRCYAVRNGRPMDEFTDEEIATQQVRDP